MRYVEKNLPLLLFLNKNNRINMGKRNSNLFNNGSLKFEITAKRLYAASQRVL